MDVVLISGMSGAGKATAARALEERGYTVVDNLPPSHIPSLAAEMENSGVTDKLCIVSDARSGNLIHGLNDAIVDLKVKGTPTQLIFIDASNSVLVSRFSETRKHHPHGTDDRGVLAGVQYERSLIQPIKSIADTVIDTTDMVPELLRQRVCDCSFANADKGEDLAVNLTSFGFKFGLPIDSDLVFDVRFLANPYYDAELRPYDGRNRIIDEFVMKDPAALPYIEKLVDLLTFSLPRFIGEGKAYLTVAIGCTGGRHRSVVVSERLGTELRKLGYRVVNNHRDVSK